MNSDLHFWSNVLVAVGKVFEGGRRPVRGLLDSTEWFLRWIEEDLFLSSRSPKN